MVELAQSAKESDDEQLNSMEVVEEGALYTRQVKWFPLNSQEPRMTL